jgi:hypothetical protein
MKNPVVHNDHPGRVFLEQRGYTMSAHAGDYSSASLVRRTEDGYVLHADVCDDSMRLTMIMGLLQLHTGNLQNCHPRFDWFEEQLLNVARHGYKPKTMGVWAPPMSVEEGIRHTIGQLKGSDIEHARRSGECRGFAALHELMDANKLLPVVPELDIMNRDSMDYLNAVIEGVDKRLLS